MVIANILGKKNSQYTLSPIKYGFNRGLHLADFGLITIIVMHVLLAILKTCVLQWNLNLTTYFRANLMKACSDGLCEQLFFKSFPSPHLSF
jgi:hypothetical protein